MGNESNEQTLTNTSEKKVLFFCLRSAVADLREKPGGPCPLFILTDQTEARGVEKSCLIRHYIRQRLYREI